MDPILAQVNLRDYVLGPVNNGIENISDPFELISAILPNAYIISGLILFIYLIAGGFILVTSGGNPKNAQQGQGIITNAIIGFIIIFASFWIIQIIQVITGLRLLGGLTIL